ncbi:hypothetical protein QUF80_14655 [Desulfococcaceae bacterium HSG8]|nr:hypothetical protein [Desulfococcaceae bacterium HSG8]
MRNAWDTLTSVPAARGGLTNPRRGVLICQSELGREVTRLRAGN